MSIQKNRVVGYVIKLKIIKRNKKLCQYQKLDNYEKILLINIKFILNKKLKI